MQLFSEIEPIREASRRMVRGLGILDPNEIFGIPFSQRHALIEIERVGSLTVNALGDALRVDRSVASRMVSSLQKRGWVTVCTDPNDARKKVISLTDEGARCTRDLNIACDEPVAAALRLLSPTEREQVVAGLSLYGNALMKASKGKDLTIREITKADDPHVAQLIRSVMTEIGVVGPGFSINDPEVLAMAQNYLRPQAAYFVVCRDRQIVGAGGFGPLNGAPDDVCELRKMYFLPEVRGLGKAQELISLILSEAKAAGYRTMYLETTNKQLKARALYERNGFQPLESPMGDTGHCGCDTFYALTL